MNPKFDVISSLNIAYLVMRKCGCSSIKQAMSTIRDQHPATTAAEIHAGQLVHGSELNRDQDWFTFTIVRDPITRFLSFYANKILDQNLAGNHTFVHRQRFGFRPNMTLDAAIRVVLDPDFVTEPHLVPQSQLIDSIGFELDYIGNLEEFSKCLTDIEKLSGVKLPAQHLNQAKQKPLIPNQQQFERLAQFYRDDLIRFNYADNFEDWYKINVEHCKDKFQAEEGFEFEGEAKLLRHQVTKQKNRYLIELFWRVEDTQHYKRVIRIVKRNDDVREKIWHLPPNLNLSQDADANRYVHEKVAIPFSSLPEDIDPDEIFFELYFAKDNQSRPRLLNYRNHPNMLVFALTETGQQTPIANG